MTAHSPNTPLFPFGHGLSYTTFEYRNLVLNEITLDPRSFQYWDEVSHGWTFLDGQRTIWVGDYSRDLRLSGNVAPEKKDRLISVRGYRN